MGRLNPAAITTDLGFQLIAIVHISYDPYTKKEFTMDDEVYIMLIKSQGDFARTVGVTRISLLDWAELRPIYKDIVLD